MLHAPILRLCAAALLGLCLVTAPAHALDDRQKRAAAALADKAGKAFEAGEMQKAAQLYQEAWRNDPSQPNYLYGVARTEQSARDLDHAEQHFRQFIALTGADPARVQKAQGYLKELQGIRADDKTAEAEQAKGRSDHVLAASLYLDAHRLAPDRHALLVKAAMVEREAGDTKSAAAHLRQFLASAPADAPERATAKALLQQLEPTVAPPPPPKPDLPKKNVAPPVAVPLVSKVTSPPPAQPAWRKPAKWGGVALGAAGVITAGVLAILASGQQATLDGKRVPDGRYDLDKISVADGQAQQRSINGKWTGVAVAGGVGVAAGAFGAWLLWSEPAAKVVLAPTSDGFTLAGRF